MIRYGYVDSSDDLISFNGEVIAVNDTSVMSLWKDFCKKRLVEDMREFEDKRGLPRQDWSDAPGPHVETKDDFVLLTMSETCKHLGVSLSTLHRLRTDPQFPKPIALGKKILRWRSNDLDEWLNRPIS